MGTIGKVWCIHGRATCFFHKLEAKRTGTGELDWEETQAEPERFTVSATPAADEHVSIKLGDLHEHLFLHESVRDVEVPIPS